MGAEQLHLVAPGEPADLETADVDAPVPAAPVPLGAGQMVVGHAEDHAEHDADRRADVALTRLRRRSDESAGEGTADQHRHGPGCSHLRRAGGATGGATVRREGGALDAGASRRIQSMRGGGTSLPDPVRADMEHAFGASFADVRIHSDAASAGLNRMVSARAFTTGNDIFFGAGEYDPASPGGQRVLAHELAHTLQSDGAMHRWPFGKDDPAKKDAAEKKKAEKEKAAQLKAAKKAAVAQAKKLEKSEAAHLKQERAQGTAERDKLKSTISAESAGQGKVDGSKTLKDLQSRFEKALADETTLAEFLRMQGFDEEVAAEAAYEATWVETSDKELRAVRPPRETASERLAKEVRESRTEEAVTTHERGQLLSSSLEIVFEAWEVRTRELMGGTPPKSYAVASAEAENEVWNIAPEKDRKNRPTDAGIIRQARQMAKVRTKNGTEKNAEVTDLLAKVEKKEDWVEDAESKGELAETIMGVVEKGPSKLGEKIAKTIGKSQDKDLQAGTQKAFESTDPASKLPVVGGFAKSIEVSKAAKKKGISDTDDFVGKDTKGKDLPTSTATQASEGIGKVTGIFSDLISGANAAIKMVKAIREANEERDTVKILAATKATADAAGTVGKLGKDTADLAKFIDPGVAKSVGAVIPGFNIAIAVTSVVSNTMTLATSGLHLSHANDSLTDARIRKPDAKKVDVMVAPLLHMTAGLTKTFEQAVWGTTQAVSSLVTSIATVATAGGFGIPAAVDAGMKLLDLLHKVGHFIADNVLAILAQRSREASVAALEGAAEGQFRNDPAMAVDGITTRAKKGDAVAIKFLEAYGFKPADLPTAKMSEVRDAVLSEMGENADPKTVFQSYKEKVGNLSTRWKETGELAETRNEDGKGRGFFWRVKMSLRSEKDHNRSKNKTKAQTSYVVCRVGSLVLYADALKTEKEQFLDALEKVDLLTIQNAAKDPKNSEEWRKILDDAAKEGLAKGLKSVGLKKPVSTSK